jgi:acetyltransferase-like isoleucine patch superfamily enzyme
MTGRLLGELHGGERLEADPDVLLAYLSARDGSTTLVLGAGARLRSGTVLYAGTRIGDRFTTGHHVIVREQCDIGDDVSVWSGSVVDYGCRVADGVKIHTNCYVAQHTEIRAGAFLAPGVSFANDLYPGQQASAEVMAGPVVGEEAQLGVNVTVLPYVRIGAGSIVGAGSVVTRDLPDGVVAYGSPAVVRGRVGDLTPIERRVVRDEDSASVYRLADPRHRDGEVTQLRERGTG